MTGTSLDGVDVAIAEFSSEGDDYKCDLIEFDTYEYPQDFREVALKAASGKLNIDEMSLAHFAMPRLYADAIKKLCARAAMTTHTLDAVGIHGQTLWHAPEPRKFAGIKTGATFQACSPSVLAKLVGVTVVGDFRSSDVALGGQGAPLVPIFDYYFLREPKKSVVALNIGGISNITFMPARCGKDEIVAFDAGPGNVWIDWAMKRHFNADFDKGGATAFNGVVIKEIFDELKAIPFIAKKPPKSTGREFFNAIEIERIIEHTGARRFASVDLVATLAKFTAWAIAENIRLFADVRAKIIPSGGGAKNAFVMEQLKYELPKTNIVGVDKTRISGDAKEAVCFAFLAYLTLAGKPGNIPSATGATRETVLGAICPP